MLMPEEKLTCVSINHREFRTSNSYNICSGSDDINKLLSYKQDACYIDILSLKAIIEHSGMDLSAVLTEPQQGTIFEIRALSLFYSFNTEIMEQMRKTTTGPLEGKNIILQRLDPENDYMDLYEASHGAPEKEAIFKYLYSHDLKELPPFDNPMKYKEYLTTINNDSTWIQFVAIDKKSNRKIGQINYLNVVPTHERAEIGGLWFTPEFHGTYANKESTLLLLSYMFDHLQWRRMEWKCNADNMPSRKAALKLGFQFEGIFRNHMFVRGVDSNDRNRPVNRDTAWFSIIGSEWEEKRQALFDMLKYSEQDKVDFLNKMRSNK